MVIEAVQGDITVQEVDAIVNAANQHLAGGGGVDGAIHRAAWAAQLHEACRLLAPCATGDAKATPGFNLPARWIIHAVGPRWRGGGHGEAEQLAACYRRSLVVAAELGARSIAFPAISTGIYGFPADEAASIAVHTIRDTLASAPLPIELVRLVAYDAGTLQRYRALLGDPPGD
ncbi:MAG TPA: O-acetyl-ADP-ribose deacetylase [Acidimicrobiales bacterium]|nr:O-acetyl-ADP-ribose deacetylase [Acidimicrobiales bacterium]